MKSRLDHPACLGVVRITPIFDAEVTLDVGSKDRVQVSNENLTLIYT